MRVRRYVAKYTINPAVGHGMAHLIGSIEVSSRLASLSHLLMSAHFYICTFAHHGRPP